MFSGVILFKKKKTAFFLVVCVLLFFTIPPLASAAPFSFSLGSFGGKITFATPCLNGGVALVVSPPSSGVFLFQTGRSKLYKEFMLRPGVSVVGNYSFGGFCLLTPFFGIPVQGTVRNIGTSSF
ncbi:hypothetical protein COV42_01945 [Candidatus Campbellbacteria bacterium CG11_big_fil_rev_8_21_14_0_20_44_21]|uniref:Uncharacterized protein n=1 Tax=Candidatus Campbellbacteria bacterium CG22_combo_CG10-13_8_21_14_all_43_18 TaxID=1974530 RepID=A0A2H0DWH4_9BACT|nr:MAG: hypothetical protein COW82_02480 [Candidatus Campbellbacteria bacterium CG22_combo_CG10-13_8_21_14_all_43_18]PIR24189.1 MAG: hypothetical protein COV42_01945 [Candidatus Campbellbacteria bacterium CG11_big_fil_rev_8_21_14_0_20_44_21]